MKCEIDSPRKGNGTPVIKGIKSTTIDPMMLYPLLASQLDFCFEIFKPVKRLLVDVRFPKDGRGYPERCILKIGDISIFTIPEKRKLRDGDYRYFSRHMLHRDITSKISYLYNVPNVGPSNIEVAMAYRFDLRSALSLFYPILIGFPLLLSWFSTPEVNLLIKLSTLASLIPSYFYLWLRAFSRPAMRIFSLMTGVHALCPISWLIAILFFQMTGNIIIPMAGYVLLAFLISWIVWESYFRLKVPKFVESIIGFL